MRMRERLSISSRRMLRRPLLSFTLLALLIAFILSVIFYVSERGNRGYESYPKTLQQIMILVISGFDVKEPPQSIQALLCSYLLMVLGIAYVGAFTAVIAAAFIESHLRKGITMSQVTFENHILLCGWAKRSKEVLSQLFAPDLANKRHVVLIDPDIEEAPMDHPLLKIIRGDPTETEILEQANAMKASAAIVMANQESGDPNAADARSLLIALAIETLQPDIYSCVEVLNPSNAVHFRRANVDEVISIGEISSHLITQAALHPGISRLIHDMITFGEGEELYLESVPAAFIGKTFAELSQVLMAKHDMVLVGVMSGDSLVNSRRCRWQFKGGDKVFVLSEEEPKKFLAIRG